MASFHLAVKAIGRSAGRSATAAAAYRAGVEITDERTGLVHDYTRKQGVEHSELMLPTDAPEWAADRERLWNAAELAETRKNATVAREYEIALPVELSADERRELALGLAREISERHGVAVDVSIHAPGREGDQRNHHAHLLTTTRRLGPEGLGEKTRELDQKQSGEVERWRERWAEMQNRALELANVPDRVDHRSHQRQGIEQEPTVHMGPSATAMERRAEQVAAREGGAYEPVTAVGQHNAGVVDRAGLRQDSERGTEWVRDMGTRCAGWRQDGCGQLMGGGLVAGDGGESARGRRRRAGRPAPGCRVGDGRGAGHGEAERGSVERCGGQVGRVVRARAARGGVGETGPGSEGGSRRRARASGSAGAPAGAGTRAGGRE